MHSGQLTIGQILGALRQCRQDAPVRFDFCYCEPTEIDSYRGYYKYPALGWTPTGYALNRLGRDNPPTRSDTTVASLITELELSIDGRAYEGWKGGDYYYREASPLFVANPGDTGGTFITEVDDTGYQVILRTSCGSD